MAVGPLNDRRWALAVVLTVAGLFLAWALDLRIAWALVMLGQALLLFECLSRLGLWPSRERG
jgi:hypothetical protein